MGFPFLSFSFLLFSFLLAVTATSLCAERLCAWDGNTEVCVIVAIMEVHVQAPLLVMS